MLKLIKIHSKSQLWEQFKTVDVENEAWVVSRASERDEMSQFLLSRDGYFLDQNIQGPNSFFRMIHDRTFPDFQIVSREFAEVFLKRKMSNLSSELAFDVIDEKSRLRSMTYYSALIFDPDIDENKLEEWLSISEERKLRLKPDLLLNKLFVSFFLQEKIVCEDWIVAHLQTADFSNCKLPIDKWYFDLGAEYGLMEASALQKLAKNFEITLFQTVHAFDSRYNHLLQAYERFDILENKSKSANKEIGVELKKFSSSVAESRFAVGQLQQWKQDGVAWEEMAIVAPDIKKYQDALYWQLLAENIPVNHTKRSAYIEFQDIRELLSDLSFFKKEIEFVSVKESIMKFCANEKMGLFTKIEEKLNSPFLSADQFLNLVEKCLPFFFKKHLQLSLSQLLEFRQSEINVRDFIKKTELFWERGGLGDRKEKIINALFDSTAGTVMFSFEEWIQQIEKIALLTYVNISAKQSSGIQMVSLNQISMFKLKKVFVVGLDETGFVSQFKEAIPTEDIFNLNSELGVYLEHPDLSVSSYLLDDLLSQVSSQVILSYPYKSIDSSIQNPAPQWQTRAFDQKLFEQETDSPEAIHWDWLIDNRQSEWLHVRRQEFKMDSQNWDSHPQQVPALMGFSLNEISLSPSSAQAFLDCRQKFFFQRVLKLKSVESESFDINARDKGSWYHSIFEKIIANESLYIQPLLPGALTETKKSELMERLQIDFAELTPAGFSEPMWNLVKKTYFENVIKFIVREVDLRLNFPELKNLAVEWPWEVHYDWKNFEFGPAASANSIRISGVIDRILVNQNTNQLWIVDYKSSLKNFSSFGSWISNKEFQLLLYNHVVQNHCKEAWRGRVENLSYWQLPDLAVKKGFAVGDQRLISMGYAKKTMGTFEEKEKVETEFLVHFQEMITHMREGHFYPVPEDEKTCRYCEWRLGCRAPHL